MADDLLPGQDTSVSDLREAIQRRAQEQPDRIGFVFPKGPLDKPNEFLTYGQLHSLAGDVAAVLRSEGAAGQRVLLCFSAGPEFLATFFGCIYANAIPVPVPPPRRRRRSVGIQAIANDCAATMVVATTAILSCLNSDDDDSVGLKTLSHLLVDHDAERGISTRWIRRCNGNAAEAETRDTIGRLAYLQYTSGSTGAPRGVMVTHANVLSNARALQQFAGLNHTDSQVCWLPHYHDMGLIGGIVVPIYCGFSSVLLEPAAFLQRPIRWMEEISNHRATVTSGPNFAYDLCARKTTSEQRASLDLSSLRLAVVGAEPVLPDTLDRFDAVFRPHGLRPNTLRPCYGLAEATLLVAGTDPKNGPITRTVSATALKQNRVAAATGDGNCKDEPDCLQLSTSGGIVTGSIARIVDPNSKQACPPGTIGEIWVSGPGVALGYWGRPGLSVETFQAVPADAPHGPFFLRTGDLGFFADDNLYVTGRLKDLIIINGRNHYPQDIEQTAERSHAALQPCRSAAFSIQDGGAEQVILVAEIERHTRYPDINQIAHTIRQALSEHHEIELAGLVLLQAGGLPRTSSGKTQRRACREAYMDGTLDSIAVWTVPAQVDDSTPQFESIDGKPKTEQAIQEWLVARLIHRIGPTDRVAASTPFASCGLDSVAAVGLVAELQAWLQSPVSPTLVYEYPTPQALAAHLARQMVAPKHASNDVPATEQEQQASLVREVERLSENDAAELLASEVADTGQVF
jgi:acyl-CoA synthetase (AMP-forming)/AMP-acid ligase II/acyl carrier protein